ncbi:MAG: 3-hydroxyacyl-CoA dehydrogenase family protein [Flammeovirgaceae bacterium]
MNVLVIGNNAQKEECQLKFKEQTVSLATYYQEAKEMLKQSDVVFDFAIAKNPEQIQLYSEFPNVVAFLNTTTKSLADLCKGNQRGTFVGFCGLPTFLNRPLLEVSVQKKENEETLRSTCQKLGTEFIVVDDRVGFVTPRVIAMIINEAYFTVEEGTASREDIDLAMKLGTNYPYGPFEWCSKIGIVEVHELLESLYKDTKDERYKICFLLNKEYLVGLTTS